MLIEEKFFHCNINFWYGEHKIEIETGYTAQVGVNLFTPADL